MVDIPICAQKPTGTQQLLCQNNPKTSFPIIWTWVPLAATQLEAHMERSGCLEAHMEHTAH